MGQDYSYQVTQKEKRITAHAVILFIELVISNLRELKLHSLINDFS